MPVVHDFSQSDIFHRLKKLVINHVASHYGCKIEDLEKVKKEKIVDDIRYSYDFMLEIENFIKSLVVGTELEDSLSMQFPLNLRISDGEISNEYLQRKFATDFVHLDSWANTPMDSSNFLIYIDFIGGPGSCCKVYERTFDERIESYRGSYHDISTEHLNLQEVEFTPKSGNAVIFDNFSPHGTKRLGPGIRLSIDVRFRKNSPYKDFDDQNISESEFLNGQAGAPALGLYWTFCKTKFESIESKIDFELRESKKIGSKAEALRLKYLTKLQNKNIFH